MTDVSTLEWIGLRFGRVGTAANLLIAAPLADGDPDVDAHTDASRIGLYFDRTGGSEKMGLVVMGTDAIAFFDDRIEIVGNAVWDAGNLINPQEKSEKGVANGYASLDGTGKVPLSELPPIGGGIIYKGAWDANTNTPALASGVGTTGDYYLVSVAGTTNLDGITTWNVGDAAVFNGTVWERLASVETFQVKANAGDATPGFLNAKVDGTSIQVNVSNQLEVIMSGISIDADQVSLDTSGFSGILSGADTDVQLAMDTLDDHTHAIGALTNTNYVSGVALTNGVGVAIDSTSSGKAWKWLLTIYDGAGATVAVEVLAAYVDATTIEFTVLPGTANFGHTIDVVISLGTITLYVTASGVGYTADALRIDMP